MALWYCHIGDKQYGPVNEDVFRAWIVEGRIKPENMVWCEGMANWVPLSSLPQFANIQMTSPPPTYEGMPPTPGGTGGQTPNGELMRQARDQLRGRWGRSICVCFLAAVISNIGNAVPYAGGIIAFVLSGPLMLGKAIFFLCQNRQKTTRISMLFEGFKNFGNALVAALLMTIFIVLWYLLFVIPGIIAAIAYSQTFYILAHDKRIDGLEAIRQSKKMMQGHKWKYFCLTMRFALWGLLISLPSIIIMIVIIASYVENPDELRSLPLFYTKFFLAMSPAIIVSILWLTPYMEASFARFHDDLRGPATAATVSSTVTVDPTQITPAQTGQTNETSNPATGETGKTFGGDLIDQS